MTSLTIDKSESNIWSCPDCDDEMPIPKEDEVIACTCGGLPSIKNVVSN